MHPHKNDHYPNLRMTRLAIIQSNYVPWKGYFDMIGLVDEFIIYDEVQYTKNDWRNRNKIKTRNGLQWITIPAYHRHLGQKISETQVSDRKWNIKHWHTLKTNYGKAPGFKEYAPRLEDFYNTVNSNFLSEINTSLLKIICSLLGIKTKISSSVDYQLSGDPTERLVSLCKQTGATSYLSGPAAKNYLQEDLFLQENIRVEWMDYGNYPEYYQPYPPFEHGVSIVDLLFNTGPDAPRYMKWPQTNIHAMT